MVGNTMVMVGNIMVVVIWENRIGTKQCHKEIFLNEKKTTLEDKHIYFLNESSYKRYL